MLRPLDAQDEGVQMLSSHLRRRVTSRRFSVVSGGLLLALATTLSACGSTESGNTKADGELFPVSLRADIYFNGAFMPFLAGIDQGIYEKHGIDLTVLPGKGSGTTVQTVANGADDIGYADGGAIIQGAGKGVSNMIIYGMLRKDPMAIATLPDSGITKPSDLNGKTGSFTPGSAGELLWPAYAKANDIDIDSVNFQKVDFALRDQLMLEGKVDFTFGFTYGNLATVAALCECELNILSYADAGLTTPSTSLFVSKSYFDKNEAQLKKFLAATAEAVEYTKANTDAAVEAFFRVDKESQLDPALVKSQWEKSLPYIESEATAGEPFGCMAKSDWESAISLQEQYGGVSKGSVDVAKLFTNAANPGACKS
jgi:NitT/TauT family transport system substrate-binding protein